MDQEKIALSLSNLRVLKVAGLGSVAELHAFVGAAAAQLRGAGRAARKPAPPVKPAANPTQVASAQSQQAFQALPEGTQKVLSSSDLVAKHGVPPEMAAQLAGMGAKPGESIADSVARNVLRGTPARAAAAAPDASTVAQVRKLPTAARQEMPTAMGKAAFVHSLIEKVAKVPLSKVGFAPSAYSGPLSDGNSTKYTSYIPPFKNPPVKTAGPPSEKKIKSAAMLDELCKLNGIISPKSQLNKTLKVGAPKASKPPGPSIQQIAKPIGYGRPQPGATKGAI